MKYQGIIDTLEVQYLSCYAVNSIDWQQISADISWQDQKHLTDRTYSHKLNKEYPINTRYQLSFFKKLINRLEHLGLEIHDEIYEAFCHLQVVSGNEERFAYKHYSLRKYNTVFTLKESRSFATDGTTGLCSWQASLALSDWLLHNPDVVRDKSVIELGSGTGLCGFIVLRCCKARSVTLTDGSTVVVDMLNTNRKLNFPDEIGDHETLSIVHLPWEACELVPHKKFDVILAADVVYDSSELGNLVAAIDNIFRLMEDKVKLVIAATVRNEDTLAEFIELLDLINFSIKDEQVVSLKDSNLYWDRSTQVRIMTVTRNTSPLN